MSPKRSNNWVSSVALDLYDLPGDTVRDKFITAEVTGDGYNTFYPKNKFVFEKVKNYSLRNNYILAFPDHKTRARYVAYSIVG